MSYYERINAIRRFDFVFESPDKEIPGILLFFERPASAFNGYPLNGITLRHISHLCVSIERTVDNISFAAIRFTTIDYQKPLSTLRALDGSSS